MHRYRIALDNGLSNYRSFLRDEGYEVIDLAGEGGINADAVLLSGQDDNVTGMMDRMTETFVLDVTGRQPDEVLHDLHRHFVLKDEGPRGSC